MAKGYVSLILHAHLPYVRHPEYPDFLEEDWLFEGITETYLPLLEMMEHLASEGVNFRLTMTLSPTLCEMFADSLLRERYQRHLNRLVELADKEVQRTAGQSAFNDTGRMYRDRFFRARQLYEGKYQTDLIRAFRGFQERGNLEIMTCVATHGFLPLMSNASAVRAQVKVAINNYRKHFGRMPNGIWLSECAYKPGDCEILKEAGLKYFILDTHGLLYGEPRPKYEVYAPVVTPSGVAVFGRDIESSRQVWSARDGYPGDAVYREFYRDLGYDADYQYIRPYLHSDGIRRNVGIKYYRITGRVELHQKQPYIRANALKKTEEHAGNFMFNRQQQAKYLSDKFPISNFQLPIMVAPYDAELFGHWWFEGPEFLETLLRKINTQQDEIALITPSEYLAKYPPRVKSTPSMSSWGDKGYNEVWLNGKNDWIYRHLHIAEGRMEELARAFPNAEGRQKDVLNQAARELLLAQASDWPFIMTTGTAEPYAHRRFKEHISRFTRLYNDLKSNRLNDEWLKDIQGKDNIFPEIDYRVYA